jgi:hypothetical protein
LLLLTFAHLLEEAASYGVVTTGKNRDQILAELNAASGLCYICNASAPTHRSATAFVQNPNT